MADHGAATVVGTCGVTLLLIAFFLNFVRVLRPDDWAYLGLNLVGAILACYSSYLIAFMPFVVLEGAWAGVALIGIGQRLRR